jgi:hypothetical protein
MAKSAKAKKLDDSDEALVQALVSAVKHAPDLRALHQALMALVHGREIGGHAFQRISLDNLRRYGGKRPDIEGAISWDPENALVLGEEGLETARIVARGEAPTSETARERRRPDERRPREQPPAPDLDAVANDGAEPDANEPSPEPTPPTVEELAGLLREHLSAAGFTVGECQVSVRASGVRFRIAATYRGTKLGGEWPWPAKAMQGDNLREFLDGLVEGLRGEG